MKNKQKEWHPATKPLEKNSLLSKKPKNFQIFFFKFAFYGLDMELEPEPEP
jgi:hypothetical protein